MFPKDNSKRTDGRLHPTICSKGTPRGKWHGVSKAIKKSSQGGACLSPGSDRCCGVARASQVTLVEKNLPANPRDIRYTGLIPGLGRSPEGGHGNPL